MSLKNLDLNELRQPVGKCALNGSQIFLPPVEVAERLENEKVLEITNGRNEIDKMDGMKSSGDNSGVTKLATVPNLHETNVGLTQSITKISEIRNFLKKVSSECKIFLENILNSNK